MSIIDLHTHSNFSDGSKTPEELLALAKSLGIEALALTDHDTCAGLERAEASAKEHQVTFIRGCELSTKSEIGELHVLGLWIPKECSELEEELAILRRKRDERNVKIVARLNSLGLPLKMEEVLACVGQGTVGRPHIAQALVKKGYVSSISQAFSEYLGSNAKAFVPKDIFKTEEAVKLLSRSKALVCLAHPLLHHYPLKWLHDMIKRLVDCGLDALEVWHTEHSESDVEQCLKWVKEFGLGASGGSDYHGQRKPGVYLGSGRGNLAIPMEVLRQLEFRHKTKILAN